MLKEKDRLVTVCDSCLRACCWHGSFYCDDYRKAGLIDKTVEELQKLDLEHPSYYSIENLKKVYGVNYEAQYKSK